MEKKYIVSSASNSSNATEEFTTVNLNGKKTIKDLIAEGKEWRKKRLKMGWEDTPDGLLPMTEIKKAGFVLNSEGEWTIPAEEYISDGNYSRPPGEKYTGASRQYLNWRESKKIRDSNRVETPVKKQLNFIKEEEVVATPGIDKDGNIDVETIPF